MKTIKVDDNWHKPDKFTGIAEYPNGDEYWYLNGKYHRVDGPAIEYAGGGKYWYLNGKMHRVGGPAEEWSDGSEFWFLNGEMLTEEEHDKRTAYLRTTLGKLIFNEHFKLEDS